MDFMRSRNMEENMAEDKISLTSGSGWTALGCIDDNNNIFIPSFQIFLLSFQ